MFDDLTTPSEQGPDGPEVVLTYRQSEELAQPVVLRYERPLPERMRPAPEGGPGARPEAAAAPPETKKRGRWGVRLFVGMSLLVGLVCLGVGIWYVGQYGWALPAAAPPQDGGYPEPPVWDGEEYYYHFDTGVENKEISIRRYPTGGTHRLSLSPAGDLPALSPSEIYDKVTASTVTVLGRQGEYSSVGTGIIFSEDGYVLTNCHVIEGCSACTVLITDSYGVDARYDARLVGYDEDVDLAVLKVSGSDLPAAQFGVSDDLLVGDPAYAIGNPLGVELRNTLTSGIVSAINRNVDVDGVTMTLIQTTAALNSGNSGGPLINQYGQVIGVNTIKMMSEYDTIEGLGFAIPSSLALRWVNELIEYGELLPQPVLGVSISRIPEALPDGTSGLRVETVTSGLTGDRAGVQVGDYVVAFNGQSVSSTEQILAIRRDLMVGDQVPIRVYRDGEYLDLTMDMMAAE